MLWAPGSLRGTLCLIHEGEGVRKDGFNTKVEPLLWAGLPFMQDEITSGKNEISLKQ